MKRQFLLPAAVGIAVVALHRRGAAGGRHPPHLGLAGFVATVTLRELSLPVRVRMPEQAEPLPRALWRTATRARRRFGGYLVHLGVVLVFVAIAASQSYVVHTTATLKPGERFHPGRYTVEMSGLRNGVDTFASALDRRRGPGDRRQRPPASPRAEDELLRAEHRSHREPCHPLGGVRGPLPDAAGLRSGRPVRQLQRLDLPDGLVDLVEPALLRARRAPRRLAGAPARQGRRRRARPRCRARPAAPERQR